MSITRSRRADLHFVAPTACSNASVDSIPFESTSTCVWVFLPPTPAHAHVAPFSPGGHPCVGSSRFSALSSSSLRAEGQLHPAEDRAGDLVKRAAKGVRAATVERAPA